jgi:PAS domain S-box-containing protein
MHRWREASICDSASGVRNGMVGSAALGMALRMVSLDYPDSTRPVVATAIAQTSPDRTSRLERQLAGLLALRSEALISVDHAHRIIFFNQGAELIFGYRAEEVMDQPLSLLVPERFQATHGAAIDRFAAANAAARPMSDRAVIYGRRRCGEEFTAEASISATGHGCDQVLTVLLRDVTDRQRSEQELQLLRTIALAIGAADDLTQAMQSALQAVCGLTGWTTGEAWLPDPENDGYMRRGAVWRDPNVPDVDSFHKASEHFVFTRGLGLVGRVWAAARPIWMQDVASSPTFRRTEIARRIGLRAGVGIPVLAGAEVVAVIVFFDREARAEEKNLVELVSAVAAQLGPVVRRRQAEDALARQAAELARSNAELEQFAYVASHDLQEPLRMVASYTQLLARRYRDKLDADGHEFIDYAVEGVRRMQTLIHDLLALSRVGTLEAPAEYADSSDALHEALGELKATIEQSGAEIEIGELPIVRADFRQLRQVFRQIVHNAVKFRSALPPRVRIEARRDGVAWQFSVSDNGIGFDPEYSERIFVVFQRLHTRDKYPGTGIGLAMCKKIVERHGGRIWAEGRDGHGATIHFTLPAAPIRMRTI